MKLIKLARVVVVPSVSATFITSIDTLFLFCTQNYVNLCSQVRCHNGGSCSQTAATSWTCHCTMGWTGLYCDVPNMSCHDFAAREGEKLLSVVLLSQ